ncbi:hypothetical protein [Lichenibacterium ramalinae]|uniref:hypothetical protein n=1 Tax=Lichenibacterium ramalinae TaxID=2316527 RepID=UPI00100E490A|nr:hypothetical protein [Lichenibacterium ramalinae]
MGFALAGWSLYIKNKADEYFSGFPVDGIALFQQGCPRVGWAELPADPTIGGSYLRIFDGSLPSHGGNMDLALTPSNIPKMSLQTSDNHASSDNSAWVTSGNHGEDKLFSFMEKDAGFGGVARTPLDWLFVGVEKPAMIRIEPKYVQFHLCKKT